jgi:trimethylamine--corrinoid protein Co-methyltransferase
MRDYIRVIHQLNVIHQEGGGPVEPTDLPGETRHLDFYESALTLTDKSWQCWALGGYRVRDAIEMTAIASGIPRGGIGNKVIAGTVINANSPLRLDIPMGEGLVELARAGQVTIATPFTLAGAMSPVTVVGALAQQNAEALFMIALAASTHDEKNGAHNSERPCSSIAMPSSTGPKPAPPYASGM